MQWFALLLLKKETLLYLLIYLFYIYDILTWWLICTSLVSETCYGVPLIVLSFDALRLIWKWNIYDVAEHEILLLHAVDVKVSKQSS